MQTLAEEAIAKNGFKPALVYGITGKNDNGYNQLAYLGAEKFKKDFGVDYVDADCVMNEAQREQIIRMLARKGNNPIVSIATEWGNAIRKVALDYPNTKFSVFHSVINMPNVQSVYWDSQNMPFLAGVRAALYTKTNKIGTIIGSDFPIIQTDVCGFKQGVKYANKDIHLVNNIVDPNLGGWNDPARGVEIAKSQIDRGVDVIYSLAGNTDYGVIKAINGAEVIGIFSAFNRNALSRYVLLSIVADPGVVVYKIFKEVMDNKWTPGIVHIGLRDKEAQYLEMNPHHSAPTSKSIEEKINKVKEDIIDGKLKVIDYRINNSCPD